jgi:L-lactate dehydrogenase complex protein LldE
MAGPRVALFVTCLVDLIRPQVGWASVKLLEEAGCTVEVPEVQTCCGQPAWNSGDRETARSLARRTIEAFEGYDHVVVPSGSCAATIARDYEAMFDEGDPWRERARALGARTHEIVSFLSDQLGIEVVPAAAPVTVTYHDSCSGLRALGIRDQPRRLLARIDGLDLREMAEADVCCGFGGTFCVKYPDISNVMVADKTRNIEATGAELVLAGDLGCLMNIAGRARREGRAFRARHVVEVLAGMLDEPPIGEAR